MSADDLARVLHAMTDGLDDEGAATWPDPQHREVYALAVEEVAGAILDDPAPLLAALTEAGVLTEEVAPATDMVPINGRNGRMIIVPGRHRYVTEWTEAQPRGNQ